MAERTYEVVCYQPHGTRDPSAYMVTVAYRGRFVAHFDGEQACERAMAYVSRNGTHAKIRVEDRA